jgi:hypothetical protein
MPTTQPTVSAVLRMAYAEARRLASSPDQTTQRTPQMQRAIELTWGAIRNHLLADDSTTRELDRLIVEITKPEGVPAGQGASHG